ncbi:MAG TPA: hypothetical protein VI306_08145 [Pyrinomonadaceae bacterium]
MDANKPADSDAAKPVNPELPKERQAELKNQFDNLECDFKKPETFVQILNRAQAEQARTQEIAGNSAKKYKPTQGNMTPCGNGDFESQLDPNEWQGASGPVPLNMNVSFPFASYTAGLSSGPITSANAHQTWVGPGSDPNVASLSTTAPGSNGAVRIGNDVGIIGDPCSLLSKTLLVSAANAYITFWYALVMKCPHGAASFTVRVSDASGNTIPGAFDFGNGSNTLSYAGTNPMWTALGGLSDGDSVYKDWSCAQIDLSLQIGKVVTIEFVVTDCFIGKSAYAYIDRFCGTCKGSPSGTLSYDCENSSHCGKGKICFAYNLPTAKDPKTGQLIVGQVEIKLGIYQNGKLIQTLTSGALGTGSRYCFDIDPNTIPGINSTLGFDFTALGTFSIGSTQLGSTHIGIPPEGVPEGRNNDYLIECKSCEQINQEQNALLAKNCAGKFNTLKSYDCHCPDSTQTGCGCTGTATTQTERPHCIELEWPKIQPCFSVKWGDSQCDCLETNDVETLCITVCNCYTNVAFEDLSIGQIRITNMDGTPIPTLPDGTPSAQIIPSGSLCFGTVPPCTNGLPSCVSREVVLYTRGAKGGNYRVVFEGVCFSVTKHVQTDACFVLPLCSD